MASAGFALMACEHPSILCNVCLAPCQLRFHSATHIWAQLSAHKAPTLALYVAGGHQSGLTLSTSGRRTSEYAVTLSCCSTWIPANVSLRILTLPGGIGIRAKASLCHPVLLSESEEQSLA